MRRHKIQGLYRAKKTLQMKEKLCNCSELKMDICKGILYFISFQHVLSHIYIITNFYENNLLLLNIYFYSTKTKPVYIKRIFFKKSGCSSASTGWVWKNQVHLLLLTLRDEFAPNIKRWSDLDKAFKQEGRQLSGFKFLNATVILKVSPPILTFLSRDVFNKKVFCPA